MDLHTFLSLKRHKDCSETLQITTLKNQKTYAPKIRINKHFKAKLVICYILVPSFIIQKAGDKVNNCFVDIRNVSEKKPDIICHDHLPVFRIAKVANIYVQEKKKQRTK